MGFTLKVEGNESLFYGENIVQMVTASFDTPNLQTSQVGNI
ncbi:MULTISPECIES: hypothetical protein [Megamonas]|nr:MULTISPECIES: hypothetical protein [Megamonas]